MSRPSLRPAFPHPASYRWPMARPSLRLAFLHPACCLWLMVSPFPLCRMVGPSPRSTFFRPVSSVWVAAEYCLRPLLHLLCLLVVKQHCAAFHVLTNHISNVVLRHEELRGFTEH